MWGGARSATRLTSATFGVVIWLLCLVFLNPSLAQSRCTDCVPASNSSKVPFLLLQASLRARRLLDLHAEVKVKVNAVVRAVSFCLDY